MLVTSTQQAGFTLIEVLVTFLIVAIGLLGLGALQVNTMNNSFETYQRALVGSIVEDMAARIRMNPNAAMAGEYFLEPPDEETCKPVITSPEPTFASQRDLCEWHAQIKGSSATVAGDASGNESDPPARNVGAPLGARGCIDRLSTSGSGELWIRVSVAWIGITPQSETELSCGQSEMGDESFRRVVFRDVAVR